MSEAENTAQKLGNVKQRLSVDLHKLQARIDRANTVLRSLNMRHEMTWNQIVIVERMIERAKREAGQC